MTGFGALVSVFLRDLARRKLVWSLVILTVGILAVYYGADRAMSDAVGNGETWDRATRTAASHLDKYASSLRGWLGFVVVMLSAQVAPESRRNGAAQFVLSCGVRRGVLAASQFVALALLIVAGVVILHVGFAAAGLRTGAMTGREALAAWLALLVPLLAVSAAVFSFSLTASPLETYLVFVGVPLFTHKLPGLLGGFPRGCPEVLTRAFDNLSLFFPDVEDVITWPHLTFGEAAAPPFPEWRWPVAHVLVATAFWIVLGALRHRHHDFGSRTAIK